MADADLPPPPPGGDAFVPSDEQASPVGMWIRPPRAGELTPPWRLALLVTWVLALLAFLGVWKVSEELGLGTWWLGPRSNPQPVLVRLVPSIVCAGFGAWCTSPVRRVPWVSLAGSFVLAAIAVPDFSRAAGIAAIELAIAGAVALVSLASLTGTYREAPRTTSG